MATSLLGMSTSRSYALFTIPTYLILTMIPHVYSMSLLRASKLQQQDQGTGKASKELQRNNTDVQGTKSAVNSNKESLYDITLPRAAQTNTHYATHLPSHIYSRYERARAAHNNMLENSGFVVSAVLAGLIARVDSTILNAMCASYLASRVLYVLSYIIDWIGGKKETAVLRTVWYVLGNVVLMAMWFISGLKLLNNTDSLTRVSS